MAKKRNHVSGKSSKEEIRLNARINGYTSLVSRSKTNGKEYTKPGSLKKTN